MRATLVQAASSQWSTSFATGASPYRLARYGTPLEELPADRVPELDKRWRDEVLR